MLKSTQKIQKGFTIIELLIVIAIIGILATLVLTNFQGAQAKGRDSVRQNDINSVFQKLEEYHNENGGYPDGVLDSSVLPGIDDGALVDADDDAIAYSDGSSTAFSDSDTQPTITPTNDIEYVYAAYGCTNAGAQSTVGATCEGFVLATYLERDASNKFEKTSLNAPAP